MKILAIDPGTRQSAWVVYLSGGNQIVCAGIHPNDEVRGMLVRMAVSTVPDIVVIEMMKSYGNVMGDSVLETCVWIGRFIEAWGFAFDLIPRKKVVTQLCNNPRGKDSNVRQALIDRFGGPGVERKGGVLADIKKDMWSALAVAVAWSDIKKQNEELLERGLQ